MCDEGSKFVKDCKEMKLNLLDIQHQLNFQVRLVQGHNVYKRIERKIQQISIEKTLNSQRSQWETLSAAITN